MKAASLPASVRSHGNRPENLAKEKLRVIAEQFAETGQLPKVSPRYKHAIGRRNVLLSGRNRSTTNHHLLATNLRLIPKGRERFLGSILRAARNGDNHASAWMRVFDTLLPSEQQVVDFDDICEACGVTPDQLMAIAVSTMMKMAADAAEFVASASHTEVVAQTVKSAKRISGDYANVSQRDREILLEHAKFIAGPKGVNVNVNAAAQAISAAQNAPSVPTFADSVLGAQQAHLGVQRAIAAADEAQEAS